VRDRLRKLNDALFRQDARYVLYWAQMNRRADCNHALAWAVRLADERNLPVLFYEGLTCSYPHASDRLHTFILEGVEETARRLERLGIGYCFYPRRRRADRNDVLYRLAESAAAVVTDDYPVFVAARHNASVPGRIGVPYFAVDSSCIVPTGRFEKREYAAYTLRPKLTRLLPEYLKPAAAIRPNRRYTDPPPPFHTEVNGRVSELAASCEIDHSVPPSIDIRGGRLEAERRLGTFLDDGLRRYAREKNQPAAHATSGLSPYLHFGQISSLEVALAVKERAGRDKLIAEEFLDELIVRRELAFNFARRGPGVAGFDALPEWARETMRRHAGDKRPYLYSREQLETARTADELWNATQMELLRRGVIHGYYRMYWGKKIIEWTPTYEDALDAMIDFHDRYALDGRDPNTYANILWCFGLHDRPWFERPVFGTIRYMSLEGMRRKTRVADYIREIGGLG
jgi:deoxyribodipyrimidine photo-lyase